MRENEKAGKARSLPAHRVESSFKSYLLLLYFSTAPPLLGGARSSTLSLGQRLYNGDDRSLLRY